MTAGQVKLYFVKWLVGGDGQFTKNIFYLKQLEGRDGQITKNLYLFKTDHRKGTGKPSKKLYILKTDRREADGSPLGRAALRIGRLGVSLGAGADSQATSF